MRSIYIPANCTNSKTVELKEHREDARIFCVFKNKIKQMYNEIKNNFVGDFCHAIVFGTPLIITLRNKKNNNKHEIILDTQRTSNISINTYYI